MTHRTITAEEARTLREAATPGPWLCWSDAEVSTTPSGAPDDGGDIVAMTYSATNNAIIAAAPDLAATVEALHAEVERLRSRLSWTSGKLEAILKDLELTLESAP